MDNAQSRLRHDTRSDPDHHHVASDHGVVEPMTAEQAWYLQALSQQAREPGAFNERLTRLKPQSKSNISSKKSGWERPMNETRPILARQQK